jgi:hypothetical protein
MASDYQRLQNDAAEINSTGSSLKASPRRRRLIQSQRSDGIEQLMELLSDPPRALKATALHHRLDARCRVGRTALVGVSQSAANSRAIDSYFDCGQRPAARSLARCASRSSRNHSNIGPGKPFGTA